MAVQVRAAFPNIIIPGRYGIQRPRWPFVFNRDSPQAVGLGGSKGGWWPLMPANDDTFRDLANLNPNAVLGSGAAQPSWTSDTELLTVVDFDGNDYATVADNDLISFGDQDFTVAIWVKFRTLPVSNNFSSLINKLAGADREYELFYRGTATPALRFEVATGVSSSRSVLWSGTVVANRWYLMFGWHDSVANTINISVFSDQDSDRSDSVAHTEGCRDGANPLTFGAFSDQASRFLDGFIGEVSIYDQVLPAAVRHHKYNPPTRWDLHYELGRVFYSFPAPAAVGNPWHVYAQQ